MTEAEQKKLALDLGYEPAVDRYPRRCSMTCSGGGYIETRRCIREKAHPGYPLHCDFGPRDFEPSKGVLTP